MKRREFIAGLGAVAWPVRGRAQAIPRIGLLRNTRAADSIALMVSFRQGLKEVGFIEGQNVAIEYRWADGQIDRLPELAADLVRHGVDTLVCCGNNETRVGKAATTTIPIVFVSGDDPIRLGHVTALNRPEGNVTGASFFSGSTMASKRVELLHGLVPQAKVIAFLVNPNSGQGELELRATETAAPALGLELPVYRAAREQDFESVFSEMVHRHVGALVVGGDVLFLSRRTQLIALAARHAIPTSYQLREYVTAGGLMSYGASIANAYRQAGGYAGQILRGAKPADLPVLLPTRFDFVINLKTTQALGLEIPHKLLALADEVIE
jgi:putative ABC transport system substrate-binding protein